MCQKCGDRTHQPVDLKRRHLLKSMGWGALALGLSPVVTGCFTSSGKEAARNVSSMEKSAAVQARKARHLTILQTTDIHAQLLSHPEMFIQNGKPVFKEAGGYARLKTVFNQVRQEKPGQTLIVDCGDCFQGSAIATWSRGEALVPVINAMGYDVILPGNREVQHGPDKFETLLKSLRANVVAANVFKQASGERLFPASRVLEMGRVKVGFIGLTDHLVPKRQAPAYSKGLAYKPSEEVLAEQVQFLREKQGCELVIALGHLGLAQQIDLSKKPQCAGVDFLLGGDTHERVREPIKVGYAAVTEPGAFGSFVGRLDVVVEDGKLKDFSYQLIEVTADRFPEDPAVRTVVMDVRKPYEEKVRKVVGRTETPLYRYSILETPMDNLITDALREYTRTDIALSNGFRFSPPILPGEITEEDLWMMIPVESQVKVGQATGKQIVDWLENELNNVFAKDPTRRFGGWVVRFSGMTLKFTAGNEPGKRVQEVRVGGKPLELDRLYTIAACERPGDPEDVLCRITRVRDARTLDVEIREPLRQFLARHSPVKYVIEGRVVATDLPGVVYSQSPGVPYEFV